MRKLNESTKEFKKLKRESTPSASPVKSNEATAALRESLSKAEQALAVKEKECEKLRYASVTEDGLQEREAAVRRAEEEVQKGKDELARKVQMYNERVRVLNKATKDLKAKRDEFRKAQQGAVMSP